MLSFLVWVYLNNYDDIFFDFVCHATSFDIKRLCAIFFYIVCTVGAICRNVCNKTVFNDVAYNIFVRSVDSTQIDQNNSFIISHL